MRYLKDKITFSKILYFDFEIKLKRTMYKLVTNMEEDNFSFFSFFLSHLKKKVPEA